ncbi:MAG: extracellular solute-binding protein [Chitinophagaceae bacterium]|nr:extracellular solute-binding protein [Oligoflexus sp.]
MKNGLLALGLVLASLPAYAKDTLMILSPHRKSIQDEYVPAFVEYYKAKFKTDVQVDWLDQGGTSDDVRFVRAKFGSNPKTSGVDIFWGGGTGVFVDLQKENFLAQYKLPKELKAQIPENASGVPLYDKTETWYASACSSFGMFYNKKIMKFDGMPEPKSFRDLAGPDYFGNISLTDPRRSGTANTMNTIILQTEGWEKGWQLLSELAGNTRTFTHSSSDPIKAVVAGDVSMAMAIDFYALAKIGDLGTENLGFALPTGSAVLDPDPIAILKGAPNRKVAERFVDYVLSVEGQKLLLLPKGVPGGPKSASLGRMSVNTEAYKETEGKRIYKLNPFTQKGFVRLDIVKAAKLQRVFNDLAGAMLVDTHDDLKKAWAKIVKSKKPDQAKILEFGKVPVTEDEFFKIAEKWDDEVFRNQTINSWVSFAKVKFKNLQ